jgi:DNA invertase Pin-like site-specific DNA recombinase
VRVAIYLRISTDEERQPFSLEAQQERLAAYVAVQPGWVLARSYSDRMSGKRLNRPALQQALHDARAGRYELLLVFKVDRLARSTGGLAKVLEELDAAGVAFRSASEPFDTATAAGRMMMQMLGVFAEFEREMIVERTRMGLARKAARGEWTGGTPPFGYRYDPERRILLPVPTEAALVQRIFTLYADRRLGSAAISGLLNDAGQPTNRGRRWTPNRVLGVLRNPTYIGQLPFNGQQHQSSHQPIIDQELFQRAQLLLIERSDSPGAQAANATDYLLTSFLRCQRCGHGFVGTAAQAMAASTATTPASHGSGTAPHVATSSAFPPDLWSMPSSPRPWRRWMMARYSRRPPAARGRPGTPSIQAVRPNWPACGQPSRSAVRRLTGTCGPSRPGGCPRRPARTVSRSSTTRSKGWGHVQQRWKRSATPLPR